jgi:hypothetical protein
MLLPFDNGMNIPASASGMMSMLAGKIHPCVAVEFVQGPSNPLWMASEHQHIQARLSVLPGGDNGEQCRKWLHQEHSFIRCRTKCIT